MRLQDKIAEIEKYLSELGTIMPKKFQDYEPDLKTKAACERYFEVITQAEADLAFLVIRSKGLKIPEEERQAFGILAEEKIIPAKLAERLKEAKGMRNILAHQYGGVDDKIVFDSITKELTKDVREFIQNVKRALKRGAKQK